MRAKFLGITVLMALIGLVAINGQTAIAETDVTITPINEQVSLKKTTIPMFIPEDNQFPWGSVKGQASDLAERYPIIIQIFQNEEPVHFAQVEPKGDGSFEYKFRIKNVDSQTGIYSNIFEGQYTVKIFRVIPNSSLTI